MNIYNILATKPHNAHYLMRYVKYIVSLSGNKYKRGVTEKHHICPKANDMFPEFKSFTDNPWNRVNLTHRQHYVAHWLLWKAFPHSKSQFYSFDHFSNRQQTNSRTYAMLKEQRSLMMTGENNYFSKNKFVGEANGFYGKTHTEEFKQIQSERERARRLGNSWVDMYGEEVAEKMREGRSGDKNVSKRAEVREKISAAHKGRKKTPEHLAKIAATRKANAKTNPRPRMWVTNGVTAYYVLVKDGVPEGFKRGRKVVKPD